MIKRQRIWLTDEQRASATERYLAGEPVRTIAASLDVCMNNIYEAIRHCGGAVQNRVAAATRLAHRADAFNAPLTPEAEYWIGFLWADGWINWRKKSQSSVLCLAVAIKDRNHLVKLKTFLGSEHKINEYLRRNVKFGKRKVKPRRMAQLAVPSRQLTDALDKYGMCTKSLSRTAPAVLLDSRDFWRGLVDGDGYISHRSDRTKQPRIGLCGGKILMQQFLDFIRRKGLEHAISVCRGKGKRLCRADMTCSTATRTIDLLYRSASVALDRKMLRAAQYIGDESSEQ